MGGISPSEHVKTTALNEGIECINVDKRLSSGISGEIYFTDDQLVGRKTEERIHEVLGIKLVSHQEERLC